MANRNVEILSCVKCFEKSCRFEAQPCGHVYCPICVANASARGVPVCPFDHSDTGVTPCQGNTSLEEDNCYFCQYCGTKLELHEKKTHYDFCDKFLIKCRYCNIKVSRDAISYHEKNCSSFSESYLASCPPEAELMYAEKSKDDSPEGMGKIKNELAVLKKELSDMKSKLEEISNRNAEDITELKTPSNITIYGNVSTSSCTSFYVWKIENFNQLRNDAINNKLNEVYSDPFYTSRYKMRLMLYPNGIEEGKGSHLSLLLQIMRGPYDSVLKWPISYNGNLLDMDQSLRADYSYCLKSDRGKKECFSRPVAEVNPGWEKNDFIEIDQLKPLFWADDVIFFKAIINVAHTLRLHDGFF